MQASIIQDNRWSAEERNWFWSCNLLEVFWWSHKIQAQNWSYLEFYGSLKAWITTSVPKSPGKMIHRLRYYRLYIYCTMNIFVGIEVISLPCPSFIHYLSLPFILSLFFYFSFSLSFCLFIWQVAHSHNSWLSGPHLYSK